jgi:hypothetical protein
MEHSSEPVAWSLVRVWLRRIPRATKNECHCCQSRSISLTSSDIKMVRGPGRELGILLDLDVSFKSIVVSITYVHICFRIIANGQHRRLTPL